MLSSPEPTTTPTTDHLSSSNAVPPLSSFSSSENVTTTTTTKKKRKPAGTPDPDAEVISLSPRTLLESDRYVCEICNQGFQRDQNLQMHRRRHKVPWKLLKKPAEATEMVRKRVYVCPEPSCLHHEPGHALGDLVGIKKHFRRKHSNHRQWVCSRCGKGYAVQSDYKAHLKTCGTRGHACDCGRVFSRVESFIEHQDSCNANQAPQLVAGLSQTASSTSPSNDNFIATPAPRWPGLSAIPKVTILGSPPQSNNHKTSYPELQLQPTSFVVSPLGDSIHETKLQLSVGLSKSSNSSQHMAIASLTSVSIELQEELRSVTRERAVANEAREQAKGQVVMAERELANAKRFRQQAQAEFEKALAMRENAAKKINLMLLEITCSACKQQNQSNSTAGFDEVTSNLSS